MKPITKFALVFIITLVFGTVIVVTTPDKKSDKAEVAAVTK
jgi:hypothetical protein